MINKKTAVKLFFSPNFFGSRLFLISCSAAIFLLSIFLRSRVDVGSDTALYLNLGKKISNGGKYYYDFFESNFPISFYFYSWQYHLSSWMNLSPIILSEIVINLLALLSIFYSAKILKKSTIYENKAHYNLILVSYFCGFFLRPNALEFGEFGTKTSLLLIALYPYISFSFVRKIALSKKDLICRGCLMGLMPCIKPHYLILILFIEIDRFFQRKSLTKSWKFFLELDKLVMSLIGAFYLFLMLKFTPEFFEFIVWMWPKVYVAYDDWHIFFSNFWRHFAARINVFAFIFLIFSRLKFTANDRVLSLFFVAASVLMLLENVGTIDQIVIFYAVTTICFFKFLFDLATSEKFSFFDNKFIVITLVFLPLFDLEILPASIFGMGGFINIWWLIAPIYPFLLAKKLRQNFFSVKRVIIFISLYFALLSLVIVILKNFGPWHYVAANLFLLLVILFFFEKKINTKVSDKFSALSVFVIITASSCLLYSYILSIFVTIKRDGTYTFPNKFSDFTAYYSQIYAPKKEDGTIMVSTWIAHQFPLLTYLKKDGYQKFPVALLQADKGVVASNMMFSTKNLNQVFALSYFFDDLKNQLKNPQVKVIFVNNTAEILDKKNSCLIGSLEYYFLDPGFKKYFLQNFRFENHVVLTKKIKPVKKIRFITGEKPSVFDRVQPTTKKITHDFEVYVRANQ